MQFAKSMRVAVAQRLTNKTRLAILSLIKPNIMKDYKDLTYREKLTCISIYPEESKNGDNAHVRLTAYRAFGFPEEAKNDKYWRIRQEAYRALGYTEEAKEDKDEDIRYEAYQALGFTEEAKKDEDWSIRREAELYFQIKNDDMIIINGKKFSASTIEEALKQYIN